MSFIRKKDKWSRHIVLGVGVVFNDRNGQTITYSDPDKYNNVRKIRFKACGGVKLSDKPLPNGEPRWLRQDMNFAIKETDPLAPLVKDLAEGDKVFVFGVLRRSKYTSSSTGAEHNWYEVNLEYIQVLGKDNSIKPDGTDMEEQEGDYDPDDIDF